jgi:hypothetical protein
MRKRVIAMLSGCTIALQVAQLPARAGEPSDAARSTPRQSAKAAIDPAETGDPSRFDLANLSDAELAAIGARRPLTGVGFDDSRRFETVLAYHLGPFATWGRANEVANYYRRLGFRTSQAYHNGDGWYVDVG